MTIGLDIIGDIHGQATKLIKLLNKMGYTESDGVYSHPNRLAVFVSDLIDMNQEQATVLRIVRNMVDAGKAKAVMGNHEFNAICFATPSTKGGYIRPHDEKNIKQHQAFLSEFPHRSNENKEQIKWFKTLPIYLDLSDVFIIHACPCIDSLDIVRPYLNDDNTLTDAALNAYDDQSSPFYNAIEILLKGPEHVLPTGLSFTDKHGISRNRTRVKWWIPSNAPTSQRIMSETQHLNEEQINLLNRGIITKEFNTPNKPIFIGHYWMSGEPKTLSQTICCVDYSAGRNGELTAYRWNGETILNPYNFIR